MYQPPHFQEHDKDSVYGLIRAFPLGLLISAGQSGLIANPIPFLLDPETGPHGTLRCHVARPNPQWKEFLTAQDVLVVFQGTDHYIRPNWYPTKQDSGKVVPTWNYAMVQVQGQARAIEDAAWLGRQIRDLTVMMEGGTPDPWAVDDAPEPFVNAQIRGIVGIEISISAISGKWKTSQNRQPADQQGVVAGLEALGTGGASEMAQMVVERMKPTA